MTQQTKKGIAVSGIILVLALALPWLAPIQEAQAGNQYSTLSGWIRKSTFTVTNESTQHIVGANAGAVLGCVHATKATANSTFDVWDSSDATTTGREKLGSFSGAAIGSWCLDIEADLGLTYTTTNAWSWTVTYLEHR